MRRTTGNDPSIPDPLDEQEPGDPFDLEWEREVVARTVQRMRGGCAAQQWQVFVGRLWAPLTRGAATVPYEELQRQLGFGSTKEVANVLVNARLLQSDKMCSRTYISGLPIT